MRALAIAAVLAGSAGPAAAHGMRTAYVELTEASAGRAHVAIRGKVPVDGIEVTAAAPCTLGDSWLSCPDRLAGATLEIAGLGTVVSEAVIYLTLRDGSTATACVTPGSPRWTIPGAPDAGMVAVARQYVALGIEHIATGADHLLFLLALVLCLRSLRAVLLAETAFTLSHTLSFSASALGWVRVSPAAAEACIAVSLVLVALDIGRRHLAHRTAPDAVRTAGLAFAFGLVHGLGFAGGLAEIGLPPSGVPAALAGFATGVELGQVAFLALALAALALIERAPRLARPVVEAGAYAIGSVGCFWLFERITALG